MPNKHKKRKKRPCQHKEFARQHAHQIQELRQIIDADMRNNKPLKKQKLPKFILDMEIH